MHTRATSSDRQETRQFPWRNPRLALLTSLSAALLISACGGGGSDGDADLPAKPSSLSAAQLQGRWLTATAITPAQAGIVLPGAEGSTELWLLSSDFKSLSRLQLTTSGADSVSATGKTYSLPSTSANVGQPASYSGNANLNNNSLSLNAGALLLTRSDALAVPSRQADIEGQWRATMGGLTVTVDWNIAADGSLSGSSSTGCSYAGKLTARSDASAYHANLTETCLTASASFSGIATYRASPAALTLALTSTDATQDKALVVSLVKP